MRALIAGLTVVAVLPSIAALLLAMEYRSVPTIPIRSVRAIRAQEGGMQPLVNPRGIAVTPDGTLFVAEAGLGRLVMVPNGDPRQARDIATKAPPMRLGRPWALALGPNNDVYLLDHETGRLHIISAAGAWQRSLPAGSTGASALAVDADGSIYVGDTGVGVVRKLDQSGQPDLTWGDPARPGTVTLGAVVGLAAAGGEVFAAIAHQRVIVRLDRRGVPTRGQPLRSLPGDLALGSGDHLLMTDNESNRVWALGRSGQVAGRFVGDDGSELLFFQPRGIAEDARGCIYVAMNDRVQAFSRDGAAGC